MDLCQAAAAARRRAECVEIARRRLLGAAVGRFHRRLHDNRSHRPDARRMCERPPAAKRRRREAGDGRARCVCRVTAGRRLTSYRRHHQLPSARQFDQRDAASAPPPASDQLHDTAAAAAAQQQPHSSPRHNTFIVHLTITQHTERLTCLCLLYCCFFCYANRFFFLMYVIYFLNIRNMIFS